MFRKKKSKRLASETSDVTSSEAFRTEFNEGNELEVTTQQRVQEIRNLAQRPDVYGLLANSLAPSVWELEDVKRGVPAWTRKM